MVLSPQYTRVARYELTNLTNREKERQIYLFNVLVTTPTTLFSLILN